MTTASETESSARGHVSLAEPFQKLVNQGMILSESGYYIVHLVVHESGEPGPRIGHSEWLDLTREVRKEGYNCLKRDGVTFFCEVTVWLSLNDNLIPESRDQRCWKA